jgi:hypothetical protein
MMIMMTAMAPMITDSTLIIVLISFPTLDVPSPHLSDELPVRSILEPLHKHALVCVASGVAPPVQSTAITVAGIAAVSAKLITAVMLIKIDLSF